MKLNMQTLEQKKGGAEPKNSRNQTQTNSLFLHQSQAATAKGNLPQRQQSHSQIDETSGTIFANSSRQNLLRHENEVRSQNEILERPDSIDLDDSESQREKLSIVSSDSIQLRQLGDQSSICQRGTWLMSRLEWISYAQILFDQLQQITKDRVKMVTLANYLEALSKIQPLLPLQQVYESGEKTLSYNEVLKSIRLIGQKHVSFDMILDALLFNSIVGGHEQLNHQTIGDGAHLNARWSDSSSGENCEIRGSITGKFSFSNDDSRKLGLVQKVAEPDTPIGSNSIGTNANTVSRPPSHLVNSIQKNRALESNNKFSLKTAAFGSLINLEQVKKEAPPVFNEVNFEDEIVRFAGSPKRPSLNDTEVEIINVEYPVRKGSPSRTYNLTKPSPLKMKDSPFTLDLEGRLTDPTSAHKFLKIKQELRSISLSINSLLRVPDCLPGRTLTVLNISMNKLKSLSGLEVCSRLQFLNAQRNQLKSVETLGQLQQLRELYLGHNQLSQIYEVSSLQKLFILDLSCNKLSDFEKVTNSLLGLRQLKVLSLVGNTVTGEKDYSARIFKFMPQLVSVDPLNIQNSSQLCRDHIAFTATIKSNEEYNKNLQQQIDQKISPVKTIEFSISHGPGANACKKRKLQSQTDFEICKQFIRSPKGVEQQRLKQLLLKQPDQNAPNLYSARGPTRLSNAPLPQLLTTERLSPRVTANYNWITPNPPGRRSPDVSKQFGKTMPKLERPENQSKKLSKVKSQGTLQLNSLRNLIGSNFNNLAQQKKHNVTPDVKIFDQGFNTSNENDDKRNYKF